MRKIRSTNVTILVEGKGETSGVLSLPEGLRKKAAVILAHGAGNDMNNPLLARFAEGLASAGYPTLRFNFLYKERGSKAPDPEETLIKAWQGAYRALNDIRDLDVEKCIAAGKSMGGRIGSQMVADGLLPVDRLIFLGYPLHAVNNKEKLKDAHLYRIRIPMLFFEGTSDALCDLQRLRTVLNKLGAPWELHTVEGGDHSFHVPKSTGTTDEQVYQQIIDKSIKWLDSTKLNG